MKSIRERSEDAFGSEDRSEADSYLAMVLSSWKDVSQAMNRSGVLLLGFMAVFELLIAQKSLDNLAIGAFTFTNISVLQIAIPFIVACSVYNLAYLTHRWMDHQEVYYDIMRRFYPRIARNNMVFLIRPQIWIFLIVGRNTPELENMRRVDSFSARVNSVFSVLVTGIVPLIFEIQAYVHLFSTYGTSDPILWASLILSASLLTCISRFNILVKESVSLERKID